MTAFTIDMDNTKKMLDGEPYVYGGQAPGIADLEAARVAYEPEGLKIIWTLDVHIDTDDDAEVFYKGNLYCRYAKNLEIFEAFNTREEAVTYFKNEIKVIYGGKADHTISQWLAQSASNLKIGLDAVELAGNQTCSVDIASHPRYTAEYLNG